MVGSPNYRSAASSDVGAQLHRTHPQDAASRNRQPPPQVGELRDPSDHRRAGEEADVARGAEPADDEPGPIAAATGERQSNGQYTAAPTAAAPARRPPTNSTSRSPPATAPRRPTPNRVARRAARPRARPSTRAWIARWSPRPDPRRRPMHRRRQPDPKWARRNSTPHVPTPPSTSAPMANTIATGPTPRPSAQRALSNGVVLAALTGRHVGAATPQIAAMAPHSRPPRSRGTRCRARAVTRSCPRRAMLPR